MHHLFQRVVILVLALGLLFYVGCGGGLGEISNSDGTVTGDDVSLVNLDDIADGEAVAVDSSFKYVFSQDANSETVTKTTFFIHTTADASASLSSKVAYDSDSCSADLAIAASVSCTSSTECVLDPTNNLSEATEYIVCIKPGTPSANLVWRGLLPKDSSDGVLNDQGTEGLGYSKVIMTSGVVTATASGCSDISDCSSEEVCYFGACVAFSNVGIDSSADCSDGDRSTCESLLGGDTEWECVNIPTNGETCSDNFYCTDGDIFFNSSGTVSGHPGNDSASCGAVESATFVAAGEEFDVDLCIPSDFYVCMESEEESGDPEEGDENDGSIGSSCLADDDCLGELVCYESTSCIVAMGGECTSDDDCDGVCSDSGGEDPTMTCRECDSDEQCGVDGTCLDHSCAEWISIHDDTYWENLGEVWQPQWNEAESRWEPGEFTWDIYLRLKSGSTWADGFRPVKLRVTMVGDDNTFHLMLRDDGAPGENEMLQSGLGQDISGVEYDLDWTDCGGEICGDIATIYIGSADLDAYCTDIEFLAVP